MSDILNWLYQAYLFLLPDPIEDFTYNVTFEGTKQFSGMLLNLISWATHLLAYTPIELFMAPGFRHVYNHVAFVALISITCIWAYVGARVYWGVGNHSEFGEVVARTAAVMVSIKIIPYAFLLFASIANQFTRAFASDYNNISIEKLFENGNIDYLLLATIIFMIAQIYYIIRLFVQYAWRIGALTLAHAFAPLFAVLWIIPSQRNLLSKMCRSVLSLLVIQVAHTLEMWVYTWVTFGVTNESVLGINVLVQLGILQVMVQTPSYIVQRLEQWVEQPARAGSDIKKLLTFANMRKYRRGFKRLRRLLKFV